MLLVAQIITPLTGGIDRKYHQCCDRCENQEPKSHIVPFCYNVKISQDDD
jgi:hypothetical protein